MPNAFLHQSAVVTSLIASGLTPRRGILVVYAAKQPPKPLRLYDMEGCPFCRAVREALTALHLDAEIRPCPRRGTRFRPEARALGGKERFPLLVDENTGVTLYESEAIVAYLFRTYGLMDVPSAYRTPLLRPVTGVVVNGLRLARGLFARPSVAPAKPLTLTSFEGSPYSRLVRERLTELEIPYTLHNLGKEHWNELGPAARRITPNPYVPREGGKRHAFYRAHGRVQVPFLEDPNTDKAMFGSAKIIDYLEATYAL